MNSNLLALALKGARSRADAKRAVSDGLKKESEHKATRRVRQQIVADHLKEDPRYYQKLKRAGL